MLEFPDVPEGGSIEQLISCAQVDGFPTGSVECLRTPYVTVAGTDLEGKSWKDRISTKFRSRMRRARKNIAALGKLEFHQHGEADPSLLQQFYEIEASGWKGHANTAIANHPKIRLYYDEIARAASEKGYFALNFFELNGKPIAADFGLTYGGTFYGAKAGYDEAFRSYGPGHLLVEEELLDCDTRGLQRFDFLGKGEEWKWRWTSEFRKHSIWFVFRNDWYGRLAKFAKFHATPLIKKLLGRPAEMST